MTNQEKFNLFCQYGMVEKKIDFLNKTHEPMTMFIIQCEDLKTSNEILRALFILDRGNVVYHKMLERN